MTSSQERTYIAYLEARLAEAEAAWDAQQDERSELYRRLAEAERLLANNEPLLPPKERREIQEFLRLTDSAVDGTGTHPNCTPPCGICEPDEWEKAFLRSAVDPADGI